MTEPRSMPLDEGRRRFRRPLAWGLLLSVGLHALLALAWRAPAGSGILPQRGEPVRPAASRARLDDAVRVVEVRVPAERPPVEVPPPPAPVEAATPEVSAPRLASEAGVLRAELSRRAHARPGPPGRGGAGAGSGEVGSPPVPRSVLPEWDPPASVRGREVLVRVHVDSAGRPTGAVELVPPTPSEDFNRRLRRKVAEMTFSPARRGGRAVAGWAELTFVF